MILAYSGWKSQIQFLKAAGKIPVVHQTVTNTLDERKPEKVITRKAS